MILVQVIRSQRATRYEHIFFEGGGGGHIFCIRTKMHGGPDSSHGLLQEGLCVVAQKPAFV